jgi:hypothetical protein
VDLLISFVVLVAKMILAFVSASYLWVSPLFVLALVGVGMQKGLSKSVRAVFFSGAAGLIALALIANWALLLGGLEFSNE